MERDEILWDDLDDEALCLGTEECVAPLIEDAPDGCLFCALGDIGEDDD